MAEYATWDSAAKGPRLSLSDGDLTISRSIQAPWNTVLANQGKSSGKWYFELTTVVNEIVLPGFGISSMSLGTTSIDGYPGKDEGDDISWGWHPAAGIRFYQGVSAAVLPVGVLGDTLRFKCDLDGGNIYVAVNDGAFDADPLNVTSLLGITVFPAVGLDYTNQEFSANFGASAFNEAVPDGYNAGWYEGEAAVGTNRKLGRGLAKGIGRGIF